MKFITLGQFLSVLEIKDRRYGRRLMIEAGAIDIGNGRLRLDEDDLRAWAETRRARPAATATVTPVDTRRRTRRTVTAASLGDRWWEKAS
jgi:hypothetical protein